MVMVMVDVDLYVTLSQCL